MIINGNIIRDVLVDGLLPQATARPQRVCFVQFGDNPVIKKFVGVKMKTAAQLGIAADHVVSTAQTTAEALAALQSVVAEGYDGIVLQLPVPAGMDGDALINAVPKEMDIDVLGAEALHAFASGQSKRMPPVAAAVQTILTLHRISPINKNIVIRGRGRLVGEPVMMLFDQTGIPYTVIDANTPPDEQLAALRQADIIVSGTGTPHAVTPDMVKDGVVLIDAGTTEQSGKLAGDIDPACAAKASLYTPVPGGVGPITVACLFKNLFL